MGQVKVSQIRAADPFDRFSLITLAVVGIVLSLTWWGILRYYRRLNKAKWEVINEMETDLPVQPFTREWAILHPDGDGADLSWIKQHRHREATAVEQVVPLTFAAVYLALGIRVLCS